MKENFYIKIESIHLPDRGQTANAHNLSDEELASREVVYIDIANDKEFLTRSVSDFWYWCSWALTVVLKGFQQLQKLLIFIKILIESKATVLNCLFIFWYTYFCALNTSLSQTASYSKTMFKEVA